MVSERVRGSEPTRGLGMCDEPGGLTMSKRIVFLTMICAVALCVAPIMYGQATGSFSGTVSDKSGSAIVGATVTAISEGTGQSREAKTDDAGHYQIPLLPVANYTLHIEFQGFQTAEER